MKYSSIIMEFFNLILLITKCIPRNTLILFKQKINIICCTVSTFFFLFAFFLGNMSFYQTLVSTFRRAKYTFPNSEFLETRLLVKRIASLVKENQFLRATFACTFSMLQVTINTLMYCIHAYFNIRNLFTTQLDILFKLDFCIINDGLMVVF